MRRATYYVALPIFATLAACSTKLHLINNAPNTITGLQYKLETVDGRYRHTIPRFNSLSFYLKKGEFFYTSSSQLATQPVKQTAPIIPPFAPKGYYQYYKCDANCGHITLFGSEKKRDDTIWDVTLCYTQHNRGTFTAKEQGQPLNVFAGKFWVSSEGSK